MTRDLSGVDPLLVLATSDAPVQSLAPALVTEVYDYYWKFAAERQEIYYRRTAGDPPPWTYSSVLTSYRFTNAYRASDRVSQYLIRNVIYGDGRPSNADEIIFRVLLFKIFNRIETWELLETAFGEICYAGYRFERYDAVLSKALADGRRIYSAAYIMPPGPQKFGHRAKHRNHLLLLEEMMRTGLPRKLGRAKRMQDAFELFRSYPTIGDFLAYQFATDVNYSELTDFSEMEFVVPGPGARDGIRKCFSDAGGLNDAEIVRVVADRQESEFRRLGVEFRTLWGRPLQLVDCQNLFCEISKFARVAFPDVRGATKRARIKQRFRINPTPLSAWYPPKWGINHRISN